MTQSIAGAPVRGGHASPVKAGKATELPSADSASGEFAGVRFTQAPLAEVAHGAAMPGLFILARNVGGLAYPIYIGEGDSIAVAVDAIRDLLPAETAVADRLFCMERANARLRAATLEDLVGELNPPLNTLHRTGPAPSALMELVADRAGPWPDRVSVVDDLEVSEADLERLVKEFYGAASADPVLGPVFAAAIPDWDEHYRVVQNFWSRALLGTQRYSGMPFAAHISLNLKPEHFTRWVGLFTATARRVLPAVAAERAIAKVEHMSTCFQAGLFPPAGPGGHPHSGGHPHPHAIAQPAAARSEPAN